MGSGPIKQYLINLSVRVHTNYFGRINNRVKNFQLINSVENYLSERLDLSNGYRIEAISDYSGDDEFAESGTIGGSMVVTVKVAVDHTQA